MKGTEAIIIAPKRDAGKHASPAGLLSGRDGARGCWDVSSCKDAGWQVRDAVQVQSW